METTPFTVESLMRKRHAEEEQLQEQGEIDEKEVEKATMKVLDHRKGYLLSRLKAILDKRDPREAEEIRSQYAVMEQEAEAEEKARGQITGELRIKKTQQMTTSRRFVEVMTEYNRIQVGFPLIHMAWLTGMVCRLIIESKASKRLLVSWRSRARLPRMRSWSKCWR